MELFQFLYVCAIVLVVIGALAWGWIGIQGTNPITWANDRTFQSDNLEKAVYILVGLAGILVLFGSMQMQMA